VRMGIVILDRELFARPWPLIECTTLLERWQQGRGCMLLPIFFKRDWKEVRPAHAIELDTTLLSIKGRVNSPNAGPHLVTIEECSRHIEQIACLLSKMNGIDAKAAALASIPSTVRATVHAITRFSLKRIAQTDSHSTPPISMAETELAVCLAEDEAAKPEWKRAVVVRHALQDAKKRGAALFATLGASLQRIESSACEVIDLPRSLSVDSPQTHGFMLRYKRDRANNQFAAACNSNAALALASSPSGQAGAHSILTDVERLRRWCLPNAPVTFVGQQRTLSALEAAFHISLESDTNESSIEMNPLNLPAPNVPAASSLSVPSHNLNAAVSSRDGTADGLDSAH
jgi:hypothetical protein